MVKVKNEKSIKIFLVDDDAVFLKALEIQFMNHSNFEVKTFETGEVCIESLNDNPNIIILDYYLNGIDKTAINGLETLVKIKQINSRIPVIMLSSQDKIEVAVNCMLNKAADYVVKSETAFLRLQKSIETIFKYQSMENQLKWYMDRM